MQQESCWLPPGATKKPRTALQDAGNGELLRPICTGPGPQHWGVKEIVDRDPLCQGGTSQLLFMDQIPLQVCRGGSTWTLQHTGVPRCANTPFSLKIPVGPPS